MKKGLAISLISLLAVVAIALGILYYTNNEEKSLQIASLNSDVAEKAKQVETLQTDTASKAAQIETLEADIADKAAEIESLQTDVSDKTTQIIALQADIDGKAAQILTLIEDNNEKKGQIASLAAENTKKDGIIETLNAELSEKGSQIEALNMDVEDKISFIEALKADIATISKQIDYLSFVVTSSDSDTIANQDYETNTELLLAALEEMTVADFIKTYMDQLGLSSEIKERLSNIPEFALNLISKEDLKQVLQATLKTVSPISDPLFTDDESILTLNAEITELTSQVQSLKTDKEKQIEELENNVADKAAQIGTLQADAASKVEQNKALNDDVAGKAEQIEMLQADVDGKDKQIKALQADVAGKAAQIEALQTDVLDKNTQLDTLKALISDDFKNMTDIDVEESNRQEEASMAEVTGNIADGSALNGDFTEKKTIKDLFPDTNFAKVVRDALNKPSINSIVTQEELDTITEISFPDNLVILSLDGISHISNLQELTIFNNYISWAQGSDYHSKFVDPDDARYQGTTFPEEIGELKNLHVIKIRGGKFTKLPQSMRSLTNLTSLIIEMSLLDEIPEWIGELKSLRSISFQTTNVSLVPSSIGNLIHLETLNLSDTLIDSLPDEIGNLYSLKELEMDFSPLNYLPESIGNLQNLRKMNLRYTLLDSLPSSIEKLTLDELKIDHTNIE